MSGPNSWKSELDVGILVWYDGDEYTPRYLSKEIGIIVKRSAGKYNIPTYNVFWFAANKYTDTVGKHLLPVEQHDTYDEVQYQKLDYPSIL